MSVLRFAMCAALLPLFAPAVQADAPVLTADAPIVVPGGAGHFDWMTVDGPRHRLLASHPDKGTLVVYDLQTGDLKQLATDGEINGEAVDEADNKLFAGGGNQKVIVFDLTTLAKTAEISLTGPADSLEFDPKNGTLYVDHDDGTEVWAIDGKTNKVTGSVPIAGAPEAMAYDSVSDQLYQNIKSANSVQVIDPAKNAVQATWPTAPMTSPHGLALDSQTQRLFTAGNGKVDMIDTKTGKVLATVGIASGYVDQVAFDPATRRVYCATPGKGAGQITVLQESPDGAAVTLLGSFASPKGTHTLAVDPATHAVWISYADGKNSDIEKLTASK